MKKAIKILAIILCVCLIATAGAAITYLVVTAGTNLNSEKLINYDKSIALYDENGNKIESASLSAKRKSVRIEELKDSTINAFIASEDREFFNHNGLNYKRMLKALYKNAVSFSFKEGASTISQQLIKNTHLNGEKTISRKLKEFKLTRQLEKRYEKDDILEMYLNTIYFGHNCYGLQSASKFYFNKNAGDLLPQESAAIVGLLTSPNNFSPFKHPEKCLQKRNLVLKNMLDCGYIDDAEYETYCAMPLCAVMAKSENSFDDYFQAVFDELEELTPDLTAVEDCKIITFMDAETQNFVDNLSFESDNAVIIRRADGAITAFRSSIGSAKRQIGSTAKPIFVYAPSLDTGKLHSFTKIIDEPVDYGGYKPENFDKKYRGAVTVSESVEKSLNVPAVKALNILGLDNAGKYAAKMGVELDSDEKNLALALGGMKYGLSLKSLCDCYSTFQNGGNFTAGGFIKQIIDGNGKTIYERRNVGENVFSEGTCSVINQILINTAKSGTAKKLKYLNYDVACKTGTCGTEDGNTDAYAISYTSKHCVGVWLGDKDNEKTQIYGGTQCCETQLKILNYLYRGESPDKLEISKGTTTVNLDRELYLNDDATVIADDLSPKLNLMEVKIVQGYEPTQKSTRFSTPIIKKPQISVINNNICIQLCQTKYYSYLVERVENGVSAIIYDGAWREEIFDKPNDGVYVYKITPYFTCGDIKRIGESVIFPKVNVSGGDNYKIPDIIYKKWYEE